MRVGFAFAIAIAVFLFFMSFVGEVHVAEFFFSIFMGLLAGVVAFIKCPERLRR